MDPKTRSQSVGSRTSVQTVPHVSASPNGWQEIVSASAPLALLGVVVTAYGSLADNQNHPALKLCGAFALAAIASAVVLLGRSGLFRHRPEVEVADRAAFVLRDRRDVVRMGLALLSVGAGLIHLAVIQQHSTEYWLYGAFFVVVGVFELAWAVLVVAAPSRRLYIVGIVVNTLTIAAYVVTRTVGVLVGPAANETEKIGFGDIVATAFEALLVVGSVVLLVRAWGRGRIRAATSEAWIGTIAIAVTVFTALGLYSAVAGPPFVSPVG